MSEARGISDDQTMMSDITIRADGRIFVFGASREILEVLKTICPADRNVSRLLEGVRQSDAIAKTEAR